MKRLSKYSLFFVIFIAVVGMMAWKYHTIYSVPEDVSVKIGMVPSLKVKASPPPLAPTPQPVEKKPVEPEKPKKPATQNGLGSAKPVAQTESVAPKPQPPAVAREQKAKSPEKTGQAGAGVNIDGVKSALGLRYEQTGLAFFAFIDGAPVQQLLNGMGVELVTQKGFSERFSTLRINPYDAEFEKKIVEQYKVRDGEIRIYLTREAKVRLNQIIKDAGYDPAKVENVSIRIQATCDSTYFKLVEVRELERQESL